MLFEKNPKRYPRGVGWAGRRWACPLASEIDNAPLTGRVKLRGGSKKAFLIFGIPPF
jgi:hypothetical protein